MKLSVVAAWHQALAVRDVERLVAVCAADVEVGGPRGSTSGHDVLRRWAEDAGVSLEPTRWFCGADGEVVVAQHASWPDAGGGRTPAVALATRFTVRDGVIRRIERHGALDAALIAGGLARADEVTAGVDER